MPDLLGHSTAPKPPNPRRLARDQKIADLVEQITTARNRRELHYEQADRASGEHRAHLLRRAAQQSEAERSAIKKLARIAPWHRMVRG